MIVNLEPGIENEVSREVTEDDIATSFGSEHMPVLATSKIVAFMEYVALTSVMDKLPEGYSTVGSEIKLRHIKPVLKGTELTCVSRLTKVDGRKLYFEITLRNVCEEIANACHMRTIINDEVFLRLLGGEI